MTGDFVADFMAGVQFLGSLPGFLRRPVTLEAAGRVLQRRLERREQDFLLQARVAIYARPASPYHALLRRAGCDYGDLERLVLGDGLEGALRTLLRAGVYLTVDEFKGRRQVVRGSTTLECGPLLLRNPRAVSHIPVQTSGSRGGATVVPVDLASVRERAVNSCLAMASRVGLGWTKAHWQVPGAGAVARILEFGAFGEPPAKWFSQVDPADPTLHPRYRWSARVMRWGSVLAGRPLPSPRYVPVSDPWPVVRWMSRVLRSGGTPHLFTFVSSAVRLSQTAVREGVSLAGAQITVTGEPLSAPSLAAIQRAGASALPRYAVMECGVLGFGCQAPASPDDVHFPQDLHAMVQPGSDGDATGLPPRGLFISSLRQFAPFILLNVSMGDEADMAKERCGCPLESLGWTTHLRGIRSQEKLTAAGMTFLDLDVIKVLEEVLPSHFGGGPTDYQLVEDTGEDGGARLRLRVHPALGPLDSAAIRQAFLRALGSGSGPERIMSVVWEDERMVQVERVAPVAAASGKILHVRVEPPSRPGG